MPKKNYYTRTQRKDSFSAWAWRRVHVGEAWFTSHEIAKAFGMQASTHLRHMLSELISEGILKAKTEIHRTDKNGDILATKTLYRITKAAQAEYDTANDVRRLL